MLIVLSPGILSREVMRNMKEVVVTPDL